MFIYYVIKGVFDGLAVMRSDFGSEGPGFESRCRRLCELFAEALERQYAANFSKSLKNGPVEVGRGLLGYDKASPKATKMDHCLGCLEWAGFRQIRSKLHFSDARWR